MNRRELLFLWSLTLVIKLALASWVPLSGDEAYYWVWSQHLQLSYYDHPGMVAWLFRLGQIFAGFGQSIRWPGVVLGHLGVLIWLRIFRDYLNSTQQKFYFALLLLSPLIGPGSLIITPDVPLMFFWACTVYTWKRMNETDDWKWFAALGLALGLGFCSKYQIVVFLPVLIAWMFFTKSWRLLSSRKILMTVTTGLLSAAPVLVWNWQNHFVSFAFQLHHGLGHHGWTPRWLGEYVADQIGLIFPLLLPFTLATIRQLPSWVSFFAWGPLFFFALTSLKGPVEANWSIMAYPALMALVASNKKSVTWMRATLFIWSAALVVVASQIAHPWMPGHPDWQFNDHKLYRNVERLAGKRYPLFASSYQMASQMSYDLGVPIYKLRGVGRRDFFDYLSESLPIEKKYYIAAENEFRLPDELKNQGHEIVARTRIDANYFLFEVRRN